MKIVHISDLHFGRENHEAVKSLLKEILALSPDVVVVSGDLTQRARRSEFQKAADFLKKIPFPKVVVPGNHDVPFYDVTRRFLAPFNRYIRYIDADFFPFFKNEIVTVLGINTAYSFTWKSGKVTSQQLKIAAEKFQNLGSAVKIMVVHHPFHEIFYKQKHHQDLLALKIDMVLSGHLHQSSVEVLNHPITTLNDKTLIVQAGTAVSTRLRQEKNAYNLIEINSKSQVSIAIKSFEGKQFVEKHRKYFVKKDDKWLADEN